VNSCSSRPSVTRAGPRSSWRSWWRGRPQPCSYRAGLVSSAELGRIRRLAARCELPVGILADDADPRRLANLLSRAIGTTETEFALATAHGSDALQALADTLGRLIGNSVTIESPQHRLLAFSATHGPVDRVREETILRRQGTPRALAWVAREGHLAAVLKANSPVRLPGNPQLGFSGRVAMRVAADDEVLAIIWATDAARTLDERDDATIAQAAETAAAILLRQRATAQMDAELRTALIEDVVHGRIVGVDNIRALARNLGWDVDRPRLCWLFSPSVQQCSIYCCTDGLNSQHSRSHPERTALRRGDRPSR